MPAHEDNVFQLFPIKSSTSPSSSDARLAEVPAPGMPVGHWDGPMTGAQRNMLQALTRKTNTVFDPHWSKREALDHILRLRGL